MCLCDVGWLEAVEVLGRPPAFLYLFLSQIGAKPSSSLEPGER